MEKFGGNNMGILSFEARDFGYSIISKFENILRENINSELEISDYNGLEFIPRGVKNAAFKQL